MEYLLEKRLIKKMFQYKIGGKSDGNMIINQDFIDEYFF